MTLALCYGTARIKAFVSFWPEAVLSNCSKRGTAVERSAEIADPDNIAPGLTFLGRQVGWVPES